MTDASSTHGGHHTQPDPGLTAADTYVDTHSGHIVPWTYYVMNFGALIVLMILTVVASNWQLGVFSNIIAMAIAITKAVLVVLIFMGVRWGTKLTWLWAGLGFFWFLLMFGILSDYITREWIYVQGWQNPNWYQ